MWGRRQLETWSAMAGGHAQCISESVRGDGRAEVHSPSLLSAPPHHHLHQIIAQQSGRSSHNPIHLHMRIVEYMSFGHLLKQTVRICYASLFHFARIHFLLLQSHLTSRVGSVLASWQLLLPFCIFETVDVVVQESSHVDHYAPTSMWLCHN